jgi:hypothetical protein
MLVAVRDISDKNLLYKDYIGVTAAKGAMRLKNEENEIIFRNDRV